MIPTSPELDPRYRVIQCPDVTLKGSWPKAASKFVFIFEAINLVGSVIFGDDWTGKELEAVHWIDSPRAERAQAHLLPARGGGARSSHSFGSAPTLISHPRDFHVQDWRAEQRQPLWEENGRAFERLEAAVEWLAQCCRDGTLTSYRRLREGGSSLVHMQAADWNVESPLERFVIYGGRRRHSGTQKKAGFIETYVFFERQQLLQMLELEPASQLPVRETDLSRLSPYLRLAVHVAMKRRYFEGEAIDAAPAREAEIAAVWGEFMHDVVMTAATVKQLGKLVGFPNAKAIEQGRRGGQSRKTGATPKG